MWEIMRNHVFKGGNLTRLNELGQFNRQSGRLKVWECFLQMHRTEAKAALMKIPFFVD